MQGSFIIVKSAKLKIEGTNISQKPKYPDGLITDFKRSVLIDMPRGNVVQMKPLSLFIRQIHNRTACPLKALSFPSVKCHSSPFEYRKTFTSYLTTD